MRGEQAAVGTEGAVMAPETPGKRKCEIFLCYRRKDEPFAALLLYRELTARFGPVVFLDVEMPKGRSYKPVLEQALDECSVVLVLIGPEWFVLDEGKARRRKIDDPEDPVRKEILLALQHEKALPVLVGDAELPKTSDFPEDLEELADYTSNLALRQESWAGGFSELMTALAEDFGLHPPTSATEAVTRSAAIGDEPRAELEIRVPEASLRTQWQAAVLRTLRAARLGREPVELVEVYVDSGIEAGSDSGLEGTTERIETLSRLVHSMRAPGTPKLWALLGDPGSGKSTALRHVALELAQEEDVVPVYVSLALWSREFLEGEGGAATRTRSLWRVAAETAAAGRTDEFAGYLEGEAAEGRVVLFLDGFDEIAPRLQPVLLARIGELASRPKMPIVVSSRPIGRGELLSLNGIHVAQVRTLGATEQHELSLRVLKAADAHRDFLAFVGRHRALQRLAPNPLLLSLLAWLAARKGVQSLPTDLAGLYDGILMEIVAAGYKAIDLVGVEVGFQEEQSVVEVLSEVAYGMLRDADHDAVWPRDRLLAVLAALGAETRAKLESLSEYRNDEAFLLAVARTGLWSESEGAGRGYRFVHRTLGEALAARALQERSAREVDRLAAEVKGEEARWAEVFALFVARVSKGDGKTADRWLLRLAKANPVLARRALCWVEDVSDVTVEKLLTLPGDDLDRRCALFGQIEELVGDAAGAARLLGRLAARTADCKELWFLAKALDRIATDPRVGEAAQDDAADALTNKLFQCGFGTPRPELEWCEIREGFRSFQMGSPEDEDGRDDDEGPLHPVVIEAPFWLAATPVTNRHWKLFRDDHPKNDGRPVVDVTWYEAAMFCRWLGARLPSEAEWECAARSGTTTRFCSGDADRDLDDVGWYAGNARGPMPVRQRKPNASGLYDMHGNVWEWCEDTWHRSYSGAPSDGRAWVDDGSPVRVVRVVRGGSFGLDATGCRSAYRRLGPPWDRRDDQGLRPASSSLAHLTASPAAAPALR